MNIIHLINSLHVGGAEKTLLELLTLERQHRYHVITLRPGGELKDEFAKLPHVRLTELQFGRPLQTLKSFFTFIRLVRAERANVLMTWLYHSDFFGALASLFCWQPALIWNIRHSNTTFKNEKRLTQLLLRVNMLMSYMFPKWIVYSSYAAQASHAKLGFRSSRTSVIQNGFSPPLSSEPDPRLVASPKTFKILSAGRFHPIKGHTLLFEAIKILQQQHPQSQANFFLFGRGVEPQNPQLNSLLMTLPNPEKVKCFGHHAHLYQAMQAADLFILHSHSESFPGVLIQAMAAGCLCLSTNVGDAANILDNEKLLVKSFSPQELAQKIIEIEMMNDSETSRIRDHLQTRFRQNFSGNRMLKNYQDLFIQISS